MESLLVAPPPPSKSFVAPGPRGSLLFGSLPQMRKDPIKVLSDAARDYGDVVRLRLVQDVHLINHPDHVKQVLQDNHLNYQKGFLYARMEPLVGKGLLTSEGDFWKRQRRLSQPAFHRQRIAALSEQMVQRTKQMLQRWSAHGAGPLDAHAEMTKLTFAIAGDTLFSIDLTNAAESAGEALGVALEIINDRFEQLFVTPKLIPTSENRRLSRAISTIEDVVGAILKERRARPTQNNDLLGMLLEAKDGETGEGMSDVQLRDEVMTLLLAGHETTANALAWTWYLLSTHPAVERALHEEVTRVLGGRTPTTAELPQLQYTTQVINEAMRLYPPAWFLGRKAIRDDSIGGFHIPAGSSLILSPYLLHRDARFWDNPEGFDPSRFSAEASAGRPKFAFFPFAAGPRMCIGSAFAMMEMQLVLAMVSQRYRLNLVPGQRIEPDPQVTLRPRGGVRVTLHPRS